MKKSISLIVCVLAIGLVGRAQCDKKITWNASRGEFMNASGQVEKTMDEKITVETDKTSIILKHGDKEDDALKGDIKDLVCDWKEAFKNGKSSFKSQLLEPSGDAKDAIVTIEGKDGKLTILVELVNMEGKKLRIYVDSYKENN